MGIYLGQLPPAEVARLKAELAETLIANFCYPRFFDQRTDSLRTRPVDRAKRQEVWLYLSSFDFTAWNRVDLMSLEFQHCIERLLIQFVQRNRSFFGWQGRRRMLDVRVMIGSNAVAVVQGLRGHLSGQKQGFGSPRQVQNWSAPVDGRSELTWEQVAAATMLLQQQLQEMRGEQESGTQQGRRRRSQPLRSPGHDEVSQVPPTPPSGRGQPARPVAPTPMSPPPSSPAHGRVTRETRPPTGPREQPATPSQPLSATLDLSAQPTMASGPLVPSSNGGTRTRSSGAPPQEVGATPRRPEPPSSGGEMIRGTITPAKKVTATNGAAQTPAVTSNGNSTQERVVASAAAVTSNVTANQREVMALGEDDVAIFEQMRHQMIVWLRVEAVRAGVDISGHGPAQLLDVLRQQAHYDETRLQVVSTLLNLANQVIKTGLISVLDYKQALMFHLMHTRQ